MSIKHKRLKKAAFSLFQRKNILLVIVAVFISTLFSGLIPPRRVYAAPPTNEKDFTNEIKNYFKLSAFAKCVDGGTAPVNIPTRIPQAQIPGNAHGGLSGIIPKSSETPFGYYAGIPGGSAAPGSGEGWDYVWARSDYSVSVGYTVDNSNGNWICGIGSHADEFFKLIGYNSFKDFRDKEYEVQDGYTLKAKRGQDDLKALVKGKIRDAINKIGLDDAQKYVNYLRSFLNCAEEKSSDKDVEGSGYTINDFVTLDGTVKKTAYFQRTDSGGIAVGHGSAGAEEGRLQCGEIKGKLDQYKDAYAKWAKDNKEAASRLSGSINGITGDNSNTTCESAGINISWILCPVYNFFAEITEFFYKQIIGSFLYTNPVETSPGSNSYKAWNNFRLYGNIVLLIALLVLVFGQAIGGGLIDAYTAKKMAPRILTAAILINASIYIVALLVDITNVLGRGISDLVLAPFGNLTFNPGASGTQAGAGLVVIGALIAGAGSIAGLIGAFLAGGASQIVLLVMFMVIIPTAIAIMAVFVTLIVRKGIILALILTSPVAFALYCLPNTEKYFRKWWDLLFKALLVYPIVMLIFAISNVLSYTIATNNGGFAQDLISTVIPLALQIIPLFLIPFAFKFAGGAMGSLYAAIQGGSQKAGGMLKSRQDIAKTNYRNQGLQARNRMYGALGDKASKSGGAKRAGYNFMRSRIGGHDLYAAMAQMQAERNKEMESIKDTGIDDELRGLTVNKTWANQQGPMASMVMDGKTYQSNGHVRVGSDGKREYRTLGGRWVAESDVDAAHERWGGDLAATQWALGYEMQKATTQEEQDYLFNNYNRVGQEGGSVEHLSDAQLGGIWTGAAFAKQNTDRQWKHYKYKNGQLQADGVTLMREIDERQGTYAMSQQHADTWRTMREEYERAQATIGQNQQIINGGGALTAEQQQQDELAREVVQRAQRIANSYSTQMPQSIGGQIGAAPGGAPIPAPAQPGQAPPAPAQGGTPQQPDWVVSPTGAPAATQEEIGNFVSTVLTGVQTRTAPGYTEQDGLPNRDGGQRPSVR